MTRITKEELLEKIFNDDYEHCLLYTSDAADE